MNFTSAMSARRKRRGRREREVGIERRKTRWRDRY